MQRILILLLSLTTLTGMAQDYEYKNYKLKPDQAWEPLSKSEADQSTVILMDKRVQEYQYNEDENLLMYVTRHKRLRVNDDQGIEQFNKVYIPLGRGAELLTLKARSITREGKVTELEKDRIKELGNAEEYGDLKIFAFEGLEKESDLEYFYTIRRSASIFDRETFQRELPVRNASLEIISPENLVFLARSYNGFPAMEETIKGGKRYLKSGEVNIPAMEEERYSAHDANLMRVEIKISHYTDRTDREMLTWNDAAAHIHKKIYDFDSKSMKAVEKSLKKMKVSGLDQEEKVRHIENYLKTGFALQPSAPMGDVLPVILKDSVASSSGFNSLFAAYLTAAEIPHEIGLTTDRSEVRFDKEFHSWNYLDNTLIYFPDLDQYLAPGAPEYRLGMFPYGWANNYGLFIRTLEVAGSNIAMPDPRWIDCCKAEDHYDNMVADITFGEDIRETNVKVSRAFAGHNGMFIQPYFDLIPDENREDVVKELMQFVGEGAEMSNHKVINHDRNQSPLDYPFTLEGEMKVKSLVEKAGRNYLFKIGNVIGQQVEMYQEKARQTEVEIEFPHQYKREISFTVPKGYSVKGLENLNMDIQYGDGDENTMGFVSSYKVEGDKVSVLIEEYYNNFNYPLEQFEQFREVINAAADFNKVVLIFEKES